VTFKQIYTDEDFLNVLSKESAKSTATVEKEVGCAKSTAKLFLTRLEREEKVKGVYVDNKVCGWLKL
jgi:hypothetical protein